MKGNIRFEEGLDEYRAEDGTILLTVRKKLPVVMLEGKKSVSTVINEAVRDYVQSGNLAGVSVDEILEWAAADYKVKGWDNWRAYKLATAYETKREDERVISFKFLTDSYMGGVHPNTMAGGITFDTQTGRRFALADVVVDKSIAIAEIGEFLLQETKREAYAGLLFEGYEQRLGELLTEDTWYLSELGMHVIGNEYLIAPYAAGSFDFVIPYAQAQFLREEYKK